MRILKRYQTTRILFVCLPLMVTSLYCSAQSASNITAAAGTFLKTLNSDELAKTNYVFADSLRTKWSNLPIGLFPRPGIQFGSLSDASKIAFHELLTATLSSQGYLKLTSIMQMDDILNSLYQRAYNEKKIPADVLKMVQDLKWSYDNYFVSIWGTPGLVDAWGFNFGGHHIAMNVTVKGNAISVSPWFLGSDPAQVKNAKYSGLRILSKEEDYGFELLRFLSPAQKAKAVLSTEVPKDIITNPNSSQRIDTYTGISAKEFNADQVEVLKLMIMEYTHNFEHHTAHALFAKIMKTGIQKVYFAWIGSQVRNAPHYYIIHGPDFLIEYDNVGFENDGNHIHAIMREAGNDFGSDLLKAHYLTSEHHKK